MNRIVWTVMVSLDGIFDGLGEGSERIDWMRADAEWLDYSIELLDSASTLIFGWRTLEGMSRYWPHQNDPVAKRMNDLPKIGFSRSPRTTTWRNARVSSDPVSEIDALRSGNDGVVLVMASGNLAATLTAEGLIDEYRFAINPVVLGAGVPVFAPGTPRLQLDVAETRNFASGIIELRCNPQAQATS